MRETQLAKHFGLVLALSLVALAGFVIFACSSDSSSPTEPTVEDTVDGSDDSDDSGGPDDSGDPDVTYGMLQINMTDAPTDEICKLVVYIAELRVKKDGSPPEILDGERAGVGEYDLLQLQDGQEVVLGNFEVEQGVYQFIEMLLDESMSYVVEKSDPENLDIVENCEEETTPIKIPSAKFKINGGPFEVGEQTEVLIDFDAENSLKMTGNGKTYQLKADVSIVEVD